MRGEQFRARDKKVQKLTRDGLVEQNKATGEEHLVSQRTADISFGPDRTKEQAAGRPAAKRRPARQPPPSEEAPAQAAEIRDTRTDTGHPPVKKRKQRRPEAYQESVEGARLHAPPSSPAEPADTGQAAERAQADTEAPEPQPRGRLHFEDEVDVSSAPDTKAKKRRVLPPPDAAPAL